jgi:hypothetical protein
MTAPNALFTKPYKFSHKQYTNLSKFIERTVRIKPYGLKGEAWVDETTNGRMRYVGTG